MSRLFFFPFSPYSFSPYSFSPLFILIRSHQEDTDKNPDDFAYTANDAFEDTNSWF